MFFLKIFKQKPKEPLNKNFFEGISGKKYHKILYKTENGFIRDRTTDKIVEIEKYSEQGETNV